MFFVDSRAIHHRVWLSSGSSSMASVTLIYHATGQNLDQHHPCCCYRTAIGTPQQTCENRQLNRRVHPLQPLCHAEHHVLEREPDAGCRGGVRGMEHAVRAPPLNHTGTRIRGRRPPVPAPGVPAAGPRCGRGQHTPPGPHCITSRTRSVDRGQQDLPPDRQQH